jgi:Ca-activated chloride channel homolog
MYRFLALLSICLPLLPQTPGQAPKPQQPPAQSPAEPTTRIRAGVSEVIVPVTVTDDKGKFVSNLQAKDFRILDEGRPQRITYFSHEGKQSIVVGFLVDLSAASRVHWDKFQDMILELVWQLLPGDDPRYSGYLITYSNEAQLAVNTTHENEKIADTIRRAKPAGGSALYDAIYRACTDRSLIKGEPYEPRRIIVIIGDGHDNASKHSMEEVLELSQRNLATIYAISTQSFGFNNDSQDVLEKLTSETGGHVEYPLNSLYKDVSGYLSTPRDAGNYVYEAGTGGYAAQVAAGIVRAVQGVVGDIAEQYVLRYTPDVDEDLKPKVMRRIRVEIPDLPVGININYRKFYYPNPVPLGPAASH